MDNRKDLAKTINAFRMGVIPDTELEGLIVGRDAEKKEFKHFIKAIAEEEISGLRFLNGAYGTGKTFMLEYIKEVALKENYVVANVSINSGFNLSKFDVFYTNIMNNLSIQTPDATKGTNFEDIFGLWVKKIKKENYMNVANRNVYQVIHQLNAYNNAFATVLMIYMRAIINKNMQLANIAVSWIKGDKNISYELKKQLKVKGSVDVENAMDIFKGFVKMLTLIGYKGLIVTIDEAELMMQSRSDIRMKAYSNIRYIMDACGTNDITGCGFIIAGTDELFCDDEKGFPSYAALSQRLGDNIKSSKQNIGNVRQPVVHLTRLGEGEFKNIGEKLFTIHKDYYGYEVEVDFEKVFNLVMIECRKDHQGKEVTMRYFLKKMIEILDLLEKEPNLPIFNARIKAGVKRSEI
ncbi:MAG: DUF2791 family P-loop domain-containing protein [Vallitaleaceae bacterium]|nr:DUF2791 family P-loop domain-containing protein [Vallitaleaceae bacterium]